jgi:hypothetical protein
MVYPARSVSADPLVFAVGAVHVTSILLSVAAGGDADPVDVEPEEPVDVVVPDIEPVPTLVIMPLEALGAAFEALELLVSLHPASRQEASSKEQTIHDPLAPIKWPS